MPFCVCVPNPPLLCPCRAQEVDNKTSNELRNSQQHGAQVNSHNNLLYRTKRNTQRRSASTQKGKALKAELVRTSDLREKIEQEKLACKESMQRRKEYTDELHELQGTSTKPKRKAAHAAPLPTLSASSSGRVASTSRSKTRARSIANPYPIGESVIQCFPQSVTNPRSQIGPPLVNLKTSRGSHQL